MTVTTTTEAGMHRARAESAERIDAARPVRFQWRLVRDARLQNRILAAGHDASEGIRQKDDARFHDALAEWETIFLTAFEDFTAIAAALACPHCGRIEICIHQGDTEMGTDPRGNLVVNHAPRVLRDRLRAAGDAERAQLAATREQRIAARKAALLTMMVADTKEEVNNVSP